MSQTIRKKGELIGQYATVFQQPDDKVQPEVYKNLYGFVKYCVYESYDSNDGRGEIRVPKRRKVDYGRLL